MKEFKLSRRAILRRGAALATLNVLGLSSFAAAATGGKACFDPEKQRAAERALRDSLEYVAESPDPAMVCGGCAFFTPSGDDGQCGECQILNAVVDAGGHCVSWSPKS